MDASSQSFFTFGLALFSGIVIIIISNKLKIPSIVSLLVGGIILGPSMIGVVNPESLGQGLESIVRLGVALILFEGGLNLNLKEYKVASSEIRRALTLGVLVTWGLSTVIVKILFGFSWSFSLLAGSLVIVTGPTVIGPLLKRINVKKNIHVFLHWEGIMIDPIGVFIALLCYEWIIGENAVPYFFLRLLTGAGIGFVFGYILSFIIKKRWIADEILNVFTLSTVIGIFLISDLIMPESGLEAVVIAGFVLDYTNPPQLEELKVYKAQFIELLIGLLFILLAANLEIHSFLDYGFKMILAVILVMLIVRPINILFTTYKSSSFNGRERLFLSWMAPRGIVAASMASLFAFNLRQMHDISREAVFLEAFTYSVIIGTVIIQGFSANGVGKLLKVIEPKPNGWLILGAHNIARLVGRFIQDQGFEAVCIDTNIHSVKVANRSGVRAIPDNALSVNPEDHIDLYGIGNILAITKNANLNELVCRRWSKLVKNPELYKWQASHHQQSDNIETGEAESTGKSIWQGIPLDKLISMFEKEDDVPVKIFNIDIKSFRHPERILMFTKDKTILPFIPSESEGFSKCLVYFPMAFDLDFNIRPNWIIYSNAKSMSDILHEMLYCLKPYFPELNIDELHLRLMEQEKEYPSVIGHNVALPHAYIENIHGSVVLMAKLDEKITITPDAESVDIIFLVLSPKDHPNTHINTLSKISKFVINEDNREVLIKSTSREELLNLFFPDNYQKK
jgi:NhaP-type Na+/H+ or K+/H+ antiporter/mannitol/fructose-specific phosphotransferase system IIA component (Ntr-type)